GRGGAHRVVRGVQRDGEVAGRRRRERGRELRRARDAHADVRRRDRRSGRRGDEQRGAGIAVLVVAGGRDAIDRVRRGGGEAVQLLPVGRELRVVEVEIAAQLAASRVDRGRTRRIRVVREADDE